jgi:hypothetical protein
MAISIFAAGTFAVGVFSIVLARYRMPLRIESGSEGQAGGGN